MLSDGRSVWVRLQRGLPEKVRRFIQWKKVTEKEVICDEAKTTTTQNSWFGQVN
jgi:hypothetical protein